MNFKDLLNALFGPITVTAMLRFIGIGEGIAEGGQIASDLRTFEGHFPIVLLVVTYTTAVLARFANDAYVKTHENAALTSWPAIWAYTSTVFVVLMILFCAEAANFHWWLGSYALLCLANACWNWVAIDAGERRPHVIANLLLFSAFAVTIWLFHDDPISWLYAYGCIAAMWAVKAFQRRKRRTSFRAPTIPALLRSG